MKKEDRYERRWIRSTPRVVRRPRNPGLILHRGSHGSRSQKTNRRRRHYPMQSRWILRSFALLAVLTLALPVAAFAQTSRVEGMALQGDYIKDYTGIYTYTSEVSNVGNLIYAELGTLSDPNNPAIDNSNPLTLDRSMGAILGNLWDGRFGTWGIHLREESPGLGQGDASSQPNPGFGGLDPNHNANEAIDLMWGRKSGTTSFGLRFNRSFFKAQDEAPGITTTLEFDPSATPN